uniref:Uncharacterized protein n=1 Tax=viral metagenome TaxID=1070528 RepID=A0A6C0FDI7_9ZZZZ
MYMQKIAIFGSYPFHLECVGFLLETFKDSIIDIYLKKTIDKYNYVDYYSTLYNFNIIYNNFSSKLINNYNIVFKLTSNDPCLEDKRVISILHLAEKKTICKSDKYISLTPYISGTKIFYIFPIYEPYKEIKINYANIVTMIGHYLNKYFDIDTINFIKQNSNYKFQFIINGDNDYSRLNGLTNVSLHRNISMTDMAKLISISKYILSKKYIHRDRFSGQLGLAMSFEKPLIVDLKTRIDYNLTGITFENQYTDIGKLDDISNETYNNLKKELSVKKHIIINNNALLLKKLF